MLTYEDMCLEYMKCYQDKSRIYFIENYLSTFNADVRKTTPFKLFPRQKVFLKTVAEKPNTIAIKHRQCGITTISSAWVTGQFVFCDSDSKETVLAVANKLDLAVQIIDKIRDFLNQIPRWFWGDEYYSPDPKSPKNKKSIFVRDSKQELELFNGCKCFARSSGENATRGISAASILIFDEAAFIESSEAVYASAVAASASVKDAKIIMVSTPNGHDPLYYKTYSQAIKGENNFTPVEFKWYQDLRYNRRLKWWKKDETSGFTKWDEDEVIDEFGNIKYDEERWKKLIRNGWKPTSPWYAEMCKSFNNDTMKIAQELDVSFAGSANNVVPQDVIDMHMTLNVREPLEDFKDPFVSETWFWKKPIDGHRYLIACLPEGEKVLTKRGEVNVEDVKSDDELITKEGRYTKIKHRKYREVENEKIIEIIPYNNIYSTKFTYNHKVFSSIDTKMLRDKTKQGFPRYYDYKFTMNEADKLKKDDWLAFPNYYLINEKDEDYLYDELKKLEIPLEKKDAFNEDFWWYCGIWVAEGCISKDKSSKSSYCTTSHNSKETDIMNKIVNIIKKYFNKTPNIYFSKLENGANCTFYCKELRDFLFNSFGSGALNKHIHETIKYLPINLLISFLRGYFMGDGYIDKKKNTISANSVSKKLINDLQDILFKLGIISSIREKKIEGESIIQERIVKIHNKYIINLGLYDSELLMGMFGIDFVSKQTMQRRKISTVNFSDDNKMIYFKIKEIIVSNYTGKVYNFETEDESHTYICNHISCSNCDPSSGSAADKTAIEIIDMDGEDENGIPIIEQVAEYNGKANGDTVGEMLMQYGKLYNEALIVVEDIGGYGSSVLLTLMNLGYRNLYYEDKELNSYLMKSAQSRFIDNADKMPGFRTNGVRFQMLSAFAIMLRNNEFKVRSQRVIAELETWVFKNETGRMDHQEGSHDDTITCLAMGLFVLRHSIFRMQATKKKDEAILKSFITTNSSISVPKQNTAPSSYSSRPKNQKSYMPIYTSKSLHKPQIKGSLNWMLSMMR